MRTITLTDIYNIDYEFTGRNELSNGTLELINRFGYDKTYRILEEELNMIDEREKVYTIE